MQLPVSPDSDTGNQLSQIIIWAFYGIGAGIVYLLARLGIIQGKVSGSDPDTMKLAGAIIDNDMAKQLVEAVEDNTRSNYASADAMRSLTLELARRSR